MPSDAGVASTTVSPFFTPLVVGVASTAGVVDGASVVFASVAGVSLIAGVSVVGSTDFVSTGWVSSTVLGASIDMVMRYWGMRCTDCGCLERYQV